MVLSRLAAKCAAIVDEIRKAIAMGDPDAHATADWATMQAEEVRTRVWGRATAARLCVGLRHIPCTLHLAQLAEALDAAKKLSPLTTLKHVGSRAVAPSAKDDASAPYLSPYNVRVGIGGGRVQPVMAPPFAGATRKVCELPPPRQCRVCE